MNHDGLSEYAQELIHHRAKQLVGKASITRDEVPDIEQELALDLLNRLKRYDPAKATEKTFVSRLVRNQVSRILRDRLATKRGRQLPVGSLNDLVDDGDGGQVELSETIPGGETHEQVEMRSEVAEVLNRLPPRLRVVCEALATQSVTEAAKTLGIHRCTLHSRIRELRQAFAAAGFEMPRNRSEANRVEKQ